MHAAGIYGGECCSDYVVSSYTPTLSALVDTRTNAFPRRTSAVQVLLAAEPGVPYLSNVYAEIEAVADVLKSKGLSYKTLIDAGLEDVRRALPGSHVVHLSCHGQQDLSSPLESGFLLHGGRLTISKLIELQLQNVFFAFLGACETAKGDVSQPDQTVHLAATMLFAGFSSIVGTMW